MNNIPNDIEELKRQDKNWARLRNAGLAVIGILTLLVFFVDGCGSEEKDPNPNCYKLKVVQQAGIQIIVYYADSIAWEADQRYSLWVDERDEPIMEERIREDWTISTELSDCYQKGDL